ncbi:tetratricopeptide repeat protein [Paenibacillus sp. MBLB4367]|uniref:tetratricopeptide repeat protein n=1 Tax=Paenibacillus sp. MBLB4367 TaxID=3384767 RepID=UPI0039083E1A
MKEELQYLLLQEEEWEVQDIGHGEWEEMMYWERGLAIYEKLNELEPGNDQYRFMLVRCLLELGRGLKGSRSNLQRAKELFLKVVMDDKEHSLACYRLGFLCYYDQKWKESASYFQKALLRSARYPQHKITDEQTVRAYCYQARAYMNVSRESMERGDGLWRDLPAGQRDKLKQLVLDTKEQVHNDETYKPYVLSDQKGERYISESELLELLDGGRIVLSFIEAPRTVRLYLPEHTRVRLTERPAEYLRILMESERPLSGDELHEKKFGKPMAKRSSVVRENIRRVRQEIERYTREWSKPFLLPDGEGYGWNHLDWPNPVVVYRDTDRYRNEMD